ncbi:MAG TPA: hypothetical protein PLU07_10710 [Ferruginibacter sp.]|nr:hypothetical protein [Ferruginibacter sp.]HRO18654.1 hypothetical protein [Ferruginibacter sp.]HRP34127.1 hypothetical protein [Agriterribacter sp.]HRP50524.1 hypothetical protein [Ferruginibacter sp.]
MKMLSTFVLIIFTAINALGQYGDAYHKPNEYAIQEQKWRASRPVSSGSSSTPYKMTWLNTINPMSLEEYYSLRKKNSSRSVNPNEKEEEIKKAAPQGYYEKIAAKYGMDSEDIAGLKHWDMAKPFEMAFTAAGLHKGDATFLSRMLYKVVSTKKGYEVVFVPNQNILNAGTAFAQFEKEAATAGFDQLMDYVMDFRYAGLTAINALDRLEQRFPEKREVILMAKTFPVLFAIKSLLNREYSDKERARLRSNLQTLYAEMPQVVLAEDKFAGFAVGYNEVPAFYPLYEEAIKKKDYTNARDIAMLTLLSDSTYSASFLNYFGNKLRDFKISKYKAPKVPIFTAEDVLAIYDHIKDAPNYDPGKFAVFIYKLPKEQIAAILPKIKLTQEQYDKTIEYVTSF